MALSDNPLKISFKSLRVIPYDCFTGIQNMSLDLYYAREVENSKIPIIRFYGWKPHCISLGHHQDMSNLDFAEIKKAKIDVVRRPTGGSAIFHARELTYSLIVPKENISHHELYHIFHLNLAKTLQSFGTEVTLENSEPPGNYLSSADETFACFNRTAKSEIKYNGKKVVGSAQKILKKSILQHGSILLEADHLQIINFLKLPEHLQQEQLVTLKNSSISISEISLEKIDKIAVADLLIDNLQKSLKMSDIYYKYTDSKELKSAEVFYDNVRVNIL